MPTYEVTRNFTSYSVHVVEAADAAEAQRKAEAGEGHVKTYHDDEDHGVDIVDITNQPN